MPRKRRLRKRKTEMDAQKQKLRGRSMTTLRVISGADVRKKRDEIRLDPEKLQEALDQIERDKQLPPLTDRIIREDIEDLEAQVQNLWEAVRKLQKEVS